LLFNPAAPEGSKKLAVNNLITRFGTVEAWLSSQPYLVGGQYSVADIYLFVTLSWGNYVNIDISRWPALKSYADKIAQRPAVQQAMQEEGLV
jgi:glutathione S-transferase